ncbi:receptor-like protein 19 [Neltuma alba]|uniref:receptor-like protein 19 n=1 Tax=Neltuma alba TaxID=207710 RepID=UPI0010A4E54F|nr:receptor-like protein 19 [Prosopis alba]
MACVFNFLYALLTLLLLLHTRLSLATDGEALKKCIKKERKALLLFKQGIYVDYGMQSTWRDGDDEDCCNWKGVHCSNQTGHVQILDLHGLDSPFSRGIINITLLRELHELKHLDLSYDNVNPSDIPQSIESFTNLRYLNLSNSYFVGSIPIQLGKLPNLQYVDLSNNYLDGAIPCQIENLSKLQYLNLGGNYLVGVIPYQLGNLSKLHTLRLGGDSSNLIVFDKNNGDAEWISNLSLLTNILELSYVSDVGNSQVWQHIIGKLVPKLIGLRLRGCGISRVHNLLLSTSPSNYSYSLVTLDLSSNNLNPSLFQWPFNFSSSLQQLYLSNLTTLNFGSNLQALYLRDCGLTSNNLIFTSFNPNFSSLVRLDLSYNQLTSSTIFYWISNFTFNLHELDFSYNSHSSSILDGFGNVMKSLEVLDLFNNNLQGEVPTSLGNICTLKSLTFSYNNFSGDLLRFISNISSCNRHSLQSLDLSKKENNSAPPPPDHNSPMTKESSTATQARSESEGGIYGPHMIVKGDFSKRIFKSDLKNINMDIMVKKSPSLQNGSQNQLGTHVMKDNEGKDNDGENFKGGATIFGVESIIKNKEREWSSMGPRKKVTGKRRLRGKDNIPKMK